MRMLGWSLVVVGALTVISAPLYARIESDRLYRAWLNNEKNEPAGYDVTVLEQRIRHGSQKVTMLSQGLPPAWTVASAWPAVYVGGGIVTFGVLLVAIRRPAPPIVGLTMHRLGALIVVTLALAGCLTGRYNYTPPATAPRPANSVVIDKPADVVWKAVVSNVSQRFFVINNLDKASGLMNLSYSGDPEAYVDCGIVSEYVKNARGERTYTFPGSRAQQTLEFVSDNYLYFNERRMSLEGRINLLVEDITASKTKLTANSRYILTRTSTVRRADQPVPSTRSHTTTFNSDQSDELPAWPGKPLICRATGQLEQQLLGLTQ